MASARIFGMIHSSIVPPSPGPCVQRAYDIGSSIYRVYHIPQRVAHSMPNAHIFGLVIYVWNRNQFFAVSSGI